MSSDELEYEPSGDQPWRGEEWVQVLNAEVQSRGKAAVADALGCSRAMVHQLKEAKYDSPIEKWRRKVMAELAQDRVQCPVLGAIDMDECREHRNRGFAGTNPVRVELFRTCPTCPNNPDHNPDESHE